jgi:hypothetical protein
MVAAPMQDMTVTPSPSVQDVRMTHAIEEEESGAATGAAMTSGTLAAMAALLEQQHGIIEARMEKQQDKMEQVQEKLQATVQMQWQQAEALKVREIASAMGCVSESQLEMLQTRIDALHQAKLLTEDEMSVLEDVVADYIDCRSSLNPAATEICVVAEAVKKMVGMSEAIRKDGMLARQLRRKLLVAT